MSFSAAVIGKTVFGNKRVHWGTYGGASQTGGDIDTGLRSVEHMQLTNKGSAVDTGWAAVNESMPCAGSAVTIVNDSAAGGYWLAIGY